MDTRSYPCANALLVAAMRKILCKEECTIPYISDVVNPGDLKPDAFNLITAGCGSGKTYWVLNHLLQSFPDVKPYEVVFVTSRSITKEQQARNRGTEKYDGRVLLYWNDQLSNDDERLIDCGIQLMTYDQMIAAIHSPAEEGSEVLHNVKIVIYDECHIMFSDEFMSGLSDLRIWTREVIYGARKLFIGLSATTKIIDYYAQSWGAPIRRINKDVATGYRAKQLICTNFDTIPYLISANKLPGKTIIMCHSIKLCRKLMSNLSNAALLVSKGADEFTPEMKRIRDYIIKYEELPSTFFDDDGNERDLEVLVATSTLREGFNLKESSGVRNVITCMTDELHITQFVGRCRYSVDNLVVADTVIFEDNKKQDNYIQASRTQFKEYMANKSCIAWFAPIQNLVAHDVYRIKKFVLGSDDNRFVNYINGKWLVPKGINAELREKYYIWKDSDKEEIRDMAVQCKLFPFCKARTTFIAVIKLLQNCLGYEVDSGKAFFDGERTTYKLVVSYDSEAATYRPKRVTIAEGFDNNNEYEGVKND